MKKLAGLFLATALIAGCGGLDGILSVQNSFNLKDKNGKVTNVPPGDFNVTLNQSRGSITVDFQKLNGARKKITMKIPSDFKLPQNGSFKLSATQTNQEVHLNGDVTTRSQRSEERWERESCSYTSYETVCYREPNGRVTCTQQPITRWGYRDARFYYLTTDQALNVHFTSAANGEHKAEFSGASQTTQRIDTYVGRCF